MTSKVFQKGTFNSCMFYHRGNKYVIVFVRGDDFKVLWWIEDVFKSQSNSSAAPRTISKQ